LSNLPTTQSNMNALAHLGAAAPVFHQSQVPAGVLNEGIGGSFPILTLRGKVWRIKYRGDETDLVIPPTVPGGHPQPRPTIDVVIAHASPAVAKIYYEGQYSEGDSEAPDCFSVNGLAPDPASPHKQSELCATCPKAVWGSKTLSNGKPGKACQDSKRLVVVPADDMGNEMFGGPMLLRVPPASLQDMGKYNSDLQQFGHAFYTVRTQIGFDMQSAYPKITWAAVRALSPGEAEKVIEIQNDPRTKRILSEAVDQVRAEVPAPLTHAGSAAGAVAGGPAGVAVPAATPAAPTVPTTPPAPTSTVPAAPPAPEYQMAAGETFTREQFLASGWTDEQLMTAGKMFVKQPPAPVVVAAPPAPPTPVAPPPAPAVVQTAPPVPSLPLQMNTDAGADPGPIPAGLVRVPFKQLTPAEMSALTPEQMADYMPKLVEHLAAQQAPPKATRGRRTGAVAAPPSPAPTLEAVPVPAAPPAPAQVTAPVPPPPPAGAAPSNDAALASLDDKLGKLLG